MREAIGSLSPHVACAMDPGDLERRLRDQPALGALVRVLMAGHALPAAELEAAVGTEARAALEDAGVVEADPVRGERALRASVALAPVDDLLIASDRVDRHVAGAPDFVLGPGPSTRALASLLLQKPLDAALDLGCGCGYLACRMAAGARRVVATDINPRAVELSRFNATLNGLDGIECREGSLFEPVANEAFDLIACNPPYVIAPSTTFVYRDGGVDVCRSVAREAPEHLTDGGTLLMGCNWPVRRGGDTERELAGWLTLDGCGVWVLCGRGADAATYASSWIQQQIGDPREARAARAEWLAYLREQAIESVGSGYVILRRREHGRGWLRFGTLPALRGEAGGAVERGLAAQALLAELDDDAALLEARLVPAPGLERIVHDRLAEDGWQPHSVELRLREGLCFAARVDPMAPRLIEQLDGNRTLGEAGEALATALGWQGDTFQRSLPALARRLLELSILTPAADADE